MLDSKVDIEQRISKVVEKIKNIGGEKVRFIILYGSVIKRKLTNLSDIDIAVFYDDDKKERFKFRTKILGRISNGFDIQTFQDLPLYIQKDVISTGRVIYFFDYKEIFKIYMKTIKEFENFKPRLELYYTKLGV
ncbi:MAG: nucleotidyltransferase domain-containing protein [Candidatus Helarchaeota archaeon]|nr:nucleotidyltransferase domain-containing protein [Candidatus Helarchaeota archaeon]